ncbi:hypothetical protein IGI37_001050 [Enterococcus sp. AZ194]|uniref:helix-turn-helix transcriptional regulator n=1 Tax=Enterococcus sp. AZ194 TaxID=2774629 RepID=UPI003F1F7134
MGNRNIQETLEQIKHCLREACLFSFDYWDRYRVKTERIVEPYQLVLKGNQWYIQAYCLKRKDFRLFKLVRLTNLQILETKFEPRVFPKPELDFSDRLASLQTEIEIRIHQSIMDRVLEYCSFEQFTPEGTDYYHVKFPFIENEFYYTMLFSFGNKCECLRPLHVREEMKVRSQAIARLYETKSGMNVNL